MTEIGFPMGVWHGLWLGARSLIMLATLAIAAANGRTVFGGSASLDETGARLDRTLIAQITQNPPVPNFSPTTPLAAIYRSSDELDLFGVGLDGAVNRARWDGRWHEWSPVFQAKFAQNTPIGAVSRTANHIDLWRDQLDARLLANQEKPAREWLTPIRISEELRALGYEGSYDAGSPLREIAEKQARLIKYQLTIAKLPLAKDIDEFDFAGTPLNEGLIRILASGNFLAEQRNAVRLASLLFLRYRQTREPLKV